MPKRKFDAGAVVDLLSDVSDISDDDDQNDFDITMVLSRHGKTTARGPNLARRLFYSGPPDVIDMLQDLLL